MNILLIAGLSLALGSIGLAFVFLYRTLSSREDLDISVDRCLALSPERYRPMARLLQEKDFHHLAAQSGFSADLGRRFRIERRRIFRNYLRILRRDFNRVALAFRILILR